MLAAAAAVVASPVRARQTAGPTAQEAMADEGRYLPRWIEMLDAPAERARVLTMLGPDQAEYADGILRDSLSQYAAFLGDEATALKDAVRWAQGPDPDADLVATDAVEAIVEASRGRRLVMLNEAHVASRHRQLLVCVVRALRAEGFTHLACEAFDEDVAALRVGDPVGPSHGWYLRDPVFAEAVREALELGFRLLPYEQRADQRSSAFGMSDVATLVREQVQADNLKAAMAAEPDMRVLVYVGYGHVQETGEPFAARFKHDTGIDPLTVGQSATGAFGPHVEDKPRIRQLLDRFNPTRPVVVLRAGQSPASRGTDAELTEEKTDLLVMHPVLPDVDGRPGWLADDPGRRRLEVAIPAGAGPRLLQAVHAADPDPAIPADQLLIDDAAGAVVLFLRPGRYRIRLETPSGFVLLEERVAG